MSTNQIYLKVVLMLMITSVVQSSVIDFSNDKNLLKHLEVHRCRQKCFLETLKADTNGKGHFMDFNTCRDTPDCYMCYDYCELLPKAAVDLAHSMCSDETYCSKGCRIACLHHRPLAVDNLIYEVERQ